MTDTPDPTKEQNQSKDTIFNSDIGEDWGEAFQAEDFMFSPDEEANGDFFLETDSSGGDASADPAKASPMDGGGLFDHKVAKVVPGLDKLRNLPAFLLALPLKFKIPAIGLPLALILAVFFFWQNSPEHPDQQITTQEGVDINQEKPEDKGGLFAEAEIIPEKVRKRWKLRSFLISSFDEESKATALFSIDLTFVFLLAEEDAIPTEQELNVREIVYQFFNNHPLSDLKRFNLSRGEMNRSLRAWINKQLPDFPLSAIVFNRYQIL